MVEKMRYDVDPEWTPQTARLWTETSPNSKLEDIKKELNSAKGDSVNELKNLIQKREYKKFQKKIGLKTRTELDGKLGRITFESLKYYLKSLDEIKTIQQINIQELDAIRFSVTQPQEIGQDIISLQINGEKSGNGSNDPSTKIDGDKSGEGVEEISTQDKGPTLASLGSGERSPMEGIFHEWPKLGVLGNKLQFDWTSEIKFVKPHLDDLSQLPNQFLLKIKDIVDCICISDKTVTSWDSNKDLLGETIPGYINNGRDWSYVGNMTKGLTVYVGRPMSLSGKYYDYESLYSDDKNATDSPILHEICHAIDHKYQVSGTLKFKSFYEKFYDNLGIYFKGSEGYKEFFAESLAERLKRGKEKFVKYYDQEFCDYVEGWLYA